MVGIILSQAQVGDLNTDLLNSSELREHTIDWDHTGNHVSVTQDLWGRSCSSNLHIGDVGNNWRSKITGLDSYLNTMMLPRKIRNN